MNTMMTEFETDFHAHFTRDPNACVALGVQARLDQLPDPGLGTSEALVVEARALLERGVELAQNATDFDTKLDLDLAQLMLQHEIHERTYTFNGRTMLQQMPTAGNDIGNGIFLMFINDPRPAEERLGDITARIGAIPDYLDALLGRLEKPLARWVSMDLQKTVGLRQLFTNIHTWATELGWDGVSRLAAACSAADQALTRYEERLRALETTNQLHVGDEVARDIVRLRGIDLSLEELHGIARAFLRKNAETLDGLHGKLCERHGIASKISVEKLQKELNKRFRVELPNDELEDVLERYQEERRRILGFIAERDLFPVFEDQDMVILRTPGFLTPSIPAGAMVSPPPFREGTRKSLVYLTLSDELRDEHTNLSIPGMMIHEGIPGHHLQLATASLHSSTIRRHVEAMDQAEGWTTMLEDYMLDMGYMGDLTDEARYSGKRDIARIGARVAIDLFFMTGNRDFLDVGVDCDTSSEDPFEAAGALLKAVTGFVEGRVQAELNWYSQERGYPMSYLTGNHLVWKLKQEFEEAQKGRLDGVELDRVFHKTFLDAGNMPMRFLRKVYVHQGLIAA
jgi:hypothetical protein